MLALAAWGFVATGCEDDAGGPAVEAADAATPPVVAPQTVQLAVTVTDAVAGARPTGPVLLLAEPTGGGARQLVSVASALGDLDPAAVQAELELAPGTWRLTAFVDRNDDGQFDGCPFPPTPADPLTADRRDNLYATTTVQIAPPAAAAVGGSGATIAPAAAQLVLERRLCGPGEVDTGLMGTLRLPEGMDGVADPAWLLIEPVPASEAGRGPDLAPDVPTAMPTTLRLPLLPAGLDGDIEFSLGQLLPGDYRLTFFVDADRDGRPSPCGPGLGGGDRYVAVFPGNAGSVRVEAGARTPVDVRLGAAECPAALTGLSLPITLSADVEAALADGRLDRAAALRLAFYAEDGTLLGNFSPAGSLDRLPAPVTVTGLPAGRSLRVVAWLDRDGDGVYGACGGVGAGLDVAAAVREGVRLTQDLITPLEPLALALADCDLDTAGLRGQVRVTVEPGAEGSGRPLRIELVSASGDRVGLPVFDNHWRLPSAQAYGDDTMGAGREGAPDGTPGERVGRYAATVEVPAGRYRVVLYLDSDGDGAFGPCAADGFGDRAAAGYPEAPEIELAPGRIVDLGESVLEPFDCAVADTSVAAVAQPQGVLASLVPLRLLLEEHGGYWEDVSAHPGWDALGPLALAPRRLAPGSWRLTAYFDADGDGHFAPDCAESTDVFSGQVEFVLDAAHPSAAPEIIIGAACGR